MFTHHQMLCNPIPATHKAPLSLISNSQIKKGGKCSGCRQPTQSHRQKSFGMDRTEDSLEESQVVFPLTSRSLIIAIELA